jgi:hypothetical protein
MLKSFRAVPEYCARILEQFMGARTRIGKGVVVPARHARLHRLEESIPWYRFLGSLQVICKIPALGTKPPFSDQ